MCSSFPLAGHQQSHGPWEKQSPFRPGVRRPMKTKPLRTTTSCQALGANRAYDYLGSVALGEEASLH